MALTTPTFMPTVVLWASLPDRSLVEIGAIHAVPVEGARVRLHGEHYRAKEVTWELSVPGSTGPRARVIVTLAKE